MKPLWMFCLLFLHAGNTLLTTQAISIPISSDVNQYYVQSGNLICLVLNVTMEFSITYETIGNQNLTNQFEVPVFNMVKVDGNCGTNAQKMSIKWGENEEFDITLTLVKDLEEYYMDSITLYYNITEELFPNVKPQYLGAKNASLSSNGQSTVSQGNYFKCRSVTVTDLNDNVFMKTSNIAFQAFRSSSSLSFTGGAKHCQADAILDFTAPIAIGGCLLVLVISVLIALLICRLEDPNRDFDYNYKRYYRNNRYHYYRKRPGEKYCGCLWKILESVGFAKKRDASNC